MANILIIIAQPEKRKVLTTLLSSNNHNLFVAADTTQALEIIGKENLDLIIGDSLMSPLAHDLSHELCQPLMIINAYVSGCIRRLEEDVYDKKQIIDAMKIVNYQVERAGRVLNNIKNKVVIYL